MINTPVIEFSVSEPGQRISPDSDTWKICLPAEGNPEAAGGRLNVTVGDYFRAAADFLAHGDYSTIKNAAFHTLGQTVAPQDIETINICLVKHGRFYHPSKVHVYLSHDRMFPMALNMAFSPEGNACVERECRALSALAHVKNALPSVYGHCTLEQVDDIVYSAFSAEWFDNFHEFHLSLDPAGIQRMVVWDSENGSFFLSDDDTSAVYRQSARIMTDCYNPLTCEQVQPWHHAAGDFVVNPSDGNIDVRLITVRQYTSIFQEPPAPEDWDTLSDAAVLFLISLSIRMRLDRMDGVGETAWAGRNAVSATVQGFFDGLGTRYPELNHKVRATLKQTSLEDILDYARMITGSYPPQSPDLPIIEKNLETHGADLHHALALSLE